MAKTDRADFVAVRMRLSFPPGGDLHAALAALSDEARREKLEFWLRLGFEVAAGRLAGASAAPALPAPPAVGGATEPAAVPPAPALAPGVDPLLQSMIEGLDVDALFKGLPPLRRPRKPH